SALAQPFFGSRFAATPKCETYRNPASFNRYGYPYHRYSNEVRKQARTDRFLDNHDRLDQQLSAHPGLIDHPYYVANHPALQEYLRNHPEVRRQWKSQPQLFMDRQARYDRYHQ